MTNYGRVAAEEIFWRTNYEAVQRPKRIVCSTFPTSFHISISRGRRVVRRDRCHRPAVPRVFGNLYDLGFRLVSIGP